MYAYHIDRNSNLQCGDIIYPMCCGENFYGIEKLSKWGKSIIECKISSGYFDDINGLINTCNIERNAEIIRKRYFPTMLSRLSAFFAANSLQDLKLWKSVLELRGDEKIFQVSFAGNSYRLDARFLNQNALNNLYRINYEKEMERYREVEEGLKNYWSGAWTENPLPELIIELPITGQLKVFD